MRKRLSLFAPLPLFLLLFATAPEARADPVVITGSVDFHVSPGPTANSFTLVGAGLSMNGTVSTFLQTVIRQPGQTYHLSGFFDDDFLFVQSPFTVNGITYTRSWYTGYQTLSFASTPADFVLPTDLTLTDVSFSTPFVLTGVVRARASDFDGTETVNVVGQGVATVSFYRQTSLSGSTWWMNGFNYTFAPAPEPVPEPSTLLLFGTGAAALGGRLWRRRRGGKDG